MIYDCIIIGGGASGLMCARLLSIAKVKFILLEKNNELAKKLLISGGGKCNFTNLNMDHSNFECSNPHFVKSALNQFNEVEFINLVKEKKISFFEKEKGQLFCKKNSREILNLFLDDINKKNLKLNVNISNIDKQDGIFNIISKDSTYLSKSLVIATGGVSFPKLGVSDFGYMIAKKFNHKIIPTMPSLVPICVNNTSDYSGVSLNAIISINNKKIEGSLLFTHKGFSGPVILTASLYLIKKEYFYINFLPELCIKDLLIHERNKRKKISLKKYLYNYFPNKLLSFFVELQVLDKNLLELSNTELESINNAIHKYKIKYTKNLGNDKAEVTKGGVDTFDISSKTLESKKESSLYIVGEVLDVTGELGGYNFQWAWSSAFAASRDIIKKLK